MFSNTVQLLILFSIFFSFRSQAARDAVVSIDGAMIYKGASFDSPVIAYLKKGKRVRISSRNYGPFYRVQIRRGLVGYISDIDVKVFGGSDKRKSKRKRRPKRSRDRYDDYEDEEYEEEDFGEDSSDDEWSRTDRYKGRKKRKKPVFARRYIGANLGVLNFKEEILSQSLASNVNMIGVKATGPNLLFEGPYILDLNFYYGLGVPAYYGELSESGASGFLMVFDGNLIFPYHVPPHEKWALYFGAGPTIVYTSFNITVNSTALDLKELKLGASFMAGGSYEIYKDWILKLEPKVFVEKNTYFGVFAAAQKEF